MTYKADDMSITKEKEQATYILEILAEMLAKAGRCPDETIFDCKGTGTFWYDCEDAIIEVLTKEG
jgi:hypothetical protein